MSRNEMCFGAEQRPGIMILQARRSVDLTSVRTISVGLHASGIRNVKM